MKAQDREPVLPFNPAPHITDWLFEIGPMTGEGAIGWQDMDAWSRLTGIELDPWEARTLRRLSRSFVNQRWDARKDNCPEPRVQADEIAVRKKVEGQFAAMVAALGRETRQNHD
ncbi:MAG: hypothetical protein J7530_08040 [Novosphingobium sp.]|nr:hypothetical protein [Novosphingobium sp.]